jgi:hypothetical protein
MFQLTREEFDSLSSQIVTSNLKSQIAISSSDWGGRRHPPYAFTEQGVAMLSSVLRSKTAVQVNIEMRAFVRLREILASHKDLANKLETLERKYDAQFKVVFDAIRQLMTPPTQQAENWIPGGRKGCYLRTSIVAARFDTSGIPETWNSRLGSDRCCCLTPHADVSVAIEPPGTTGTLRTRQLWYRVDL